jgi:membrane-associated phospholipid phosphatase
VLGVVATVLVGKFSMLGPVKDVDEAVFDAVVPWLQGLPGVTGFGEVVTDMGAIPLNRAIAVLVALGALVWRRSLWLALIALAIFFGSMYGHSLVINAVDGSSPTEHVLGNAGPYYSGGVVRVIALVGFALTVYFGMRRPRLVYGTAVAFGAVEGLTRLIVGRHWPFDVLASIPIGLALVWLFRAAGEPWLSSADAGDVAPVADPGVADPGSVIELDRSTHRVVPATRSDVAAGSSRTARKTGS